MMDNRFQRKFQKKEPQHKLNHMIRYPEIRVIVEGKESEIMNTIDAFNLAQSMGLDLIEVSATAKPPVCKIMDYSKYCYQLKMAEKEKKRKQRENQIELKELRFSANIDENDLNTKLRQAESFLKDGDKVKAVIKFNGREIVYKDKGELTLLSFAQKLLDFGKVEQMPKLEGKKMSIILAPKK